MEKNLKKGVLGQDCNRTACQQPGADYYNHSTDAFYCNKCADMINEGALGFYLENGYKLCEHIDDKLKRIKETSIGEVLTLDTLPLKTLSEHLIENTQKEIEDLRDLLDVRYQTSGRGLRNSKRLIERKSKGKRKYGHK